MLPLIVYPPSYENAKTGKIPAIDNRALKAVTFVFILSGINRFGNSWKMGKEK